MTGNLTNAQISRLKAEAQRIKATFTVGRAGLSPEFIRGIEESFQHRELIKVRFDAFKDQKRSLAAQLAEKTSSKVIWIIGHVAVLYRPKPEARLETGQST